jgi:hypothetical protein
MRLFESYPKGTQLGMQTPEGVVRVIAEGESGGTGGWPAMRTLGGCPADRHGRPICTVSGMFRMPTHRGGLPSASQKARSPSS